MKLIVGGAYCGKEAYVRETFLVEPVPCSPEEALLCPAVSNLHEIVKAILLRGENPDDYIRTFLLKNPKAVVLCDEIGMGIVPLDRKERQWREATGRACCVLAREADEVIRIVCGLPVYLKRTSA